MGRLSRRAYGFLEKGPFLRKLGSPKAGGAGPRGPQKRGRSLKNGGHKAEELKLKDLKPKAEAQSQRAKNALKTKGQKKLKNQRAKKIFPNARAAKKFPGRRAAKKNS